MTPEGKVKEEVKAFLKSLGPDCWWFMPVQMGYGKTGIPDFIVCYRGFFIGVETKRRKGAKAQANQEREMCAIDKAGGYAMIVNDIAQLQIWVAQCDFQYDALSKAGIL